MLKEVIQLQNDAVTELVNKFQIKDTVTFKAPTGSGKTIMMAEFMDRILNSEPDSVFIVSSLSKGNLAVQNYDTFVNQSYNVNKTLKPYLINTETTTESSVFIPTDYNVYVLPRDLFKINTKLAGGTIINKKNNISKITGGAFQNFLDEIRPTKKIYLIKDECHQATKNLDSLSAYFLKVVNVSATPDEKKKQKVDVLLDEQAAVDCHLIKRVFFGNETDTLDDALKKFVVIRERYINELHIKPCFIIQISTKEKADTEFTEIESLLSKNYPDLNWMLIVDKEADCKTNDRLIKTKPSNWKNYAKRDTSTIDIIIFKMVISEGWDIPRACMLYQVRDSKSDILNEQVIGRVRRNPRLLDYEKLSESERELCNDAYVWGLTDTKNNNIIDVNLRQEAKFEITLYTTKLTQFSQNNSCINLKNFISNSKNTSDQSIFDLYDEYRKSSAELQSLITAQSSSYNDWIEYTNNVKALEKELKDIYCDYNKTLSVLVDELGCRVEAHLPDTSDYNETEFNISAGNIIWEREDKKTEFSFDSQSELEWFKFIYDLRDLDNVHQGKRVIKSFYLKSQKGKPYYLVGKNYPNNSEICFAYYNYGVKASYPDFILKDCLDNIHIFEVKSLNKSSKIGINDKEYIEKVNALKEAYKATSKLLPYYFYLPIKKGDDWNIFQYHGQKETVFNLDSFSDFMINLK